MWLSVIWNFRIYFNKLNLCHCLFHCIRSDYWSGNIISANHIDCLYITSRIGKWCIAKCDYFSTCCYSWIFCLDICWNDLTILRCFSAKLKTLCFLISKCIIIWKLIIKLKFYIFRLRHNCQITNTYCRLIILACRCSNSKVYSWFCRTFKRYFEIFRSRINLQDRINNFPNCRNNTCIIT